MISAADVKDKLRDVYNVFTLDNVVEVTMTAMKHAAVEDGLTGTEKKAFVIQVVKELCPVDELDGLLGVLVDKLIDVEKGKHNLQGKLKWKCCCC